VWFAWFAWFAVKKCFLIDEIEAAHDIVRMRTHLRR